MPTTEIEPRRLTPTERLHDLARIAIERQAQKVPVFEVTREKASAEQSKSTGVYEFYAASVAVPVCDEFPTANEAHAALIRYMRGIIDEFPNAVAPYPVENGSGT